MNKKFLNYILVLCFGSLILSATIHPTISMRYNDLINTNNDLNALTTKLVLGFSMDVEEGIRAGFDSDGEDSRIFVSFDYGTFGMGISSANEPQFTIGAKYSALSNLDVALDYVINNLASNEDENENPEGRANSAGANELRLSLSVTF